MAGQIFIIDIYVDRKDFTPANFILDPVNNGVVEPSENMDA